MRRDHEYYINNCASGRIHSLLIECSVWEPCKYSLRRQWEASIWWPMICSFIHICKTPYKKIFLLQFCLNFWCFESYVENCVFSHTIEKFHLTNIGTIFYENIAYTIRNKSMPLIFFNLVLDFPKIKHFTFLLFLLKIFIPE